MSDATRSSQGGSAVLEIQGVTKAFGERQVLGGIDLTLREHEAIALIGASGSGKSTLLRCIDLLVEIDDGDIFLDGEVITDPSVDPVSVRRKLGFVFQAFNLFPHMKVIDNVTLGSVRAQGSGKKEAREEGRALLERFGLGGREEDMPDELSGGQQQRVAIARTLMMDPQVLLFDEPTAALDPEITKEVAEIIRTLSQTGITQVVVTHEVEFARKVASQVIYLEKGRIIESGTAAIFQSPQTSRFAEFLMH